MSPILRPRPLRIAGIDEVGRGPLAGPVLAAAVILPSPIPPALLALLGDSKALTPARRAAAYAALCATEGVEIAIAAASVAEIASLNILHAAMLAMRRAALRLASPPDLALIDGNRAPDLPFPVRCIIGGDALEPAIGAASIAAKVIRDRCMARLALRYPAYRWDANAGYAAAAHRAALIACGPTAHHRAGFGTVRRILQRAPSLRED